MRIRQIAIATLLLGTAGCTIGGSVEDDLENSIRTTLSNQGTVQEVNLTRQDDENLNGFAVVRDPTGSEVRFACTAQRSQGSDYNWRCQPTIDERVLAQVEGVIRNRLSTQADVVEVDMQRGADDDHMTGHATIRGGNGEQVRVPCSAQRSPTGGFDWRCGQDAAPAGGGQPGNTQ